MVVWVKEGFEKIAERGLLAQERLGRKDFAADSLAHYGNIVFELEVVEEHRTVLQTVEEDAKLQIAGLTGQGQQDTALVCRPRLINQAVLVAERRRPETPALGAIAPQRGTQLVVG